MPTYEYICEKCGHSFDVFQSMTAEALTVCPKERCAKRRWGHGKVRRAIGGGAGLIFKGSGFYITDYRSDAYKTAAKKDAPSSPATASTPTATGSGPNGGKSAATTPANSPNRAQTKKPAETAT